MTARAAPRRGNWTRSVRRRLARRLRDGNAVAEEANVPEGITEIRPRAVYLRPSRDAVARSSPYLLCPSSLLRPGEAFAGTHPDGTPVFAHRDGRRSGGVEEGDGGGAAKAFVNRCLHRGSPLIRPPSPFESVRTSGGGRLACPYHAWTYDAGSGRLTGVPGRLIGFPGLDDGAGAARRRLGLTPVECREAAGGIWIGGRDSTTTVEGGGGWWDAREADAELRPLLTIPPSPADDGGDGDDGDEESLGRRRRNPLIAFREWNLESDWQVAVESFLEAYHVSALHRRTLAAVAHSNVMVTDVLDGGRNLRMAVPLKYFSAEEDDGGGTTADDDDDEGPPPLPTDPYFGMTTTNYFIFPHSSVTMFKRFALFVAISPSSSAVGRSEVRAFATDHGGSAGEDRRVQERDVDRVMEGLEEDWAMAEEIQRGLNLGDGAGAEEGRDHRGGGEEATFLYGRFEGNNAAFLRNVGEAADFLRGRC